MSDVQQDTDGPPSPSIDLLVTASGASFKKRNSMRKEKLGHRRVNATGTVTYKKKSTEEIQTAIQIGINTSIGSILQKPTFDLLERDFQIIERMEFPQQGSKNTPAHNLTDFRFETYAPEAFRGFRNLFHLNMADYLNSICSKKLVELTNPGVSGSIFYMTNDDEFIIKTVQRKEAEFLHRILLSYYINLCQNPRTLLPKFYGLHTYQSGSKNIRFVVMNNLLPSLTIHEKYDLKGSTYKRKANANELAKKFPTLKDLDFREKHPTGILLEADTYDAFMHTLSRDCRLLESLSIMDYSLLLGIHNLDQAKRDRAEKAQSQMGSDTAGDEENAHQSPIKEPQTSQIDGELRSRPSRLHSKRIVTMATVMENILPEAQPVILEEEEQEVIAPGGIPARNSKGDRLLLYVGIIDILQSYRLLKKMEHAFKAIAIDPETFSVTNPKFYAQRFMNNLRNNIFRKASSLDDMNSVGPYKYRFRKLVIEDKNNAMKNAPRRKPVPSIPRRSVNTRILETDEHDNAIKLMNNDDIQPRSMYNGPAESNALMREIFNKDHIDSRSCNDSPIISSIYHLSANQQRKQKFIYPISNDLSILSSRGKLSYQDLTGMPIPRSYGSNPYLKQMSFQPNGHGLKKGTLSSSLYTPSQADSNNLDELTSSSCSLVSYDGENGITDEVLISEGKTPKNLIDEQKRIYKNMCDKVNKIIDEKTLSERDDMSEDSDIDNISTDKYRVIRVMNKNHSLIESSNLP